MKFAKLFASGAALSAVIGLSGAYARQAGSEVSVLQGDVQVQQGRDWTSVSQVPVGTWVRSGKNEAVLQLSGVSVRLESGARVRMTSSRGGTKLDARDGRVYVKVGPAAKCTVATAKSQLSAGESEFVLDADSSDRLYVVQGQANVSKSANGAFPLSNWSRSESVALDGPDVRKRNRNRRRYTQGEENKGKRIGEDEPPTQSSTPAYTETPAYTPSPSASPASPQPTATSTPAPQNNTPSVSSGGGSAWPWIGGALGLGGAAYGISRLVGGSDEPTFFPPNVIRPASP